MWKFVQRIALFLVVFVLIAEVFFRTVIPASHPPFQAQNREFGILTLDGSPSRSGQFTIGRLAGERTLWQLNSSGWNSSCEYQNSDQRDRPCVAVIGNSYVEGFYADTDSGVTSALSRVLDNSHYVYNFGKSGVNAAQMVRVARYAQHHFAPESFVFILNHGSLRTSVRNFGFVITNEQYVWADSRLQTIPPTTYQPNRLMRLHTNSALVRYLYHNAAILKSRAAIRQEAIQRNDQVAAAQLEDERPLLEAAAREVVGKVRAINPQASILFVLDADRRQMYEINSRPEPLRDSVIWEGACREYGCGFLDLTDAFWSAYQTDGRTLDLPINYHWNQHGMAVAAVAIASRLRDPAVSKTRQ